MVKWTRSTDGVGLQQVAPGALAGMRLAGDQQDAEVLADAVDLRDGGVVDGRQLALGSVDLDLDDRTAGIGQFHRRRGLLADKGALAGDILAVETDGDIDAAMFRTAGIGGRALGKNAVGQFDRLADEREARRSLEPQPAVELVLLAGDQPMDGRIESGRRRILRYVVDLAIGDQHRPGDTRGRHVAQQPVEAFEQPRLGPIGTRQTRPPASPTRSSNCGNAPIRFRRSASALSVWSVRSPMSWLWLRSTTTATTLVNGSRCSRRTTGLRSAKEQQRRGGGAEDRAAPDEHETGKDEEDERDRQSDQPGQGDQRLEGEGKPVDHWPSLSSSVGT